MSSRTVFMVTLFLLFCSSYSYSYVGSDWISQEPDAELAYLWWPPLRNVWTPIGWKDHLFRFHVLYNGSVIVEPHVHPNKTHTARWADQEILLTIAPSVDGAPKIWKNEPYQLSSGVDRGVGRQGWTDNATPVLWTEWPLSDEWKLAGKTGVVLREEIFAHIHGGQDVSSGVEPLFAWIRLSVSHVDELKAPDLTYFIIHLGSFNLTRSMFHEDNIEANPKVRFYPHRLTSDYFEINNVGGYKIIEDGEKIRLLGYTSTGAFSLERVGEEPDYFLKVSLPVIKDAHIDLLVPMLPCSEQDVSGELALGYEGALRQSDMYWSRIPSTACAIDTPEKSVNEAIIHTIKHAQVITEKNPETGECSFLSGSWNYDLLWATPTSRTGYGLDLLGYHDFVAEHLELFKKNQGSVTAPGPDYQRHPGYFSTPKTLTSIDWLSDHGAILDEVSRHALLSGDKAFISQWVEAILNACNFIEYSCSITGHGGIEGLMAPAVATDEDVPSQAVWNIAWNYKGLCSAVRLLKQIGHPEAARYEQLATSIKTIFVHAYRDKTKKMPTWTDASGNPRPFLPTSLSSGPGPNIFHPFYLDAGPLVLVWSGLMDADDELMKSIIDFFREGPNTRLYDPRGNMHQRAVLIHEISSCEPCYSFNIYHSWQLGDRIRYFEGMYSLLAGSISNQTYIGCEHRHGIFGNIFPNPLFIDLVRLSVIDELLVPGELHLLRMAPRAWFRENHLTRFERMATEIGPVTLKFKLGKNCESLEVFYESSFRYLPDRVVLHIPQIDRLTKAVINGKEISVHPGETIEVNINGLTPVAF